MIRLICLFYASVFFSGFLPQKIFKKEGVGAGTISSLITLFFQIYCLHIGLDFKWMIFIIIAVTVIGLITIPLADELILEKWGKQKNHNGEVVDEDFNQTNIDEVPGQLIAGLPIFFYLDYSFLTNSLLLFVAFVLFRIFDIYKPQPIKWCEDNFPGSFGVMFDDILAGVFSMVFILGLYLFI